MYRAIDVTTARHLASRRFLIETTMCQELCTVMDRDLEPYMAVLGRWAIYRLRAKIADLKDQYRAKVWKEWAGDFTNYATWGAIRSRVSKKQAMVMETFLGDDNKLLDPKYPWGALTLGSLMRAYAELTEVINKVMVEAKGGVQKKIDQRTASEDPWDLERLGTPEWGTPKLNDEEQQEMDRFAAYAEEEKGRMSWQERVLVTKETGLSPLVPNEQDLLGMNKFHRAIYSMGPFKKEEARFPKKAPKTVNKVIEKIDKVKKSTDIPDGQRMRFEAKIFGKEQGLRMEDLVKPSWCPPGRLRWITYPQDRVSLIGDLFGLVRGATISGTTSDCLYCAWQLACELAKMSSNTAIKVAGGKPSWAAAISAYQENMEQVIRMMFLVPLAQMGLELHHSVHEIASVLSLNYMNTWQTGYYDSLFHSQAEEQRRYEEHIKQFAHLRSTASKSAQPAKKQPKSTHAFKATAKLKKAEAEIEKTLAKANKLVVHGYFRTVDYKINPELGTDGIGGYILTRKNTAHQNASSMDSELLHKIEREKTVVSPEGVQESYIKGVAKPVSGAMITDAGDAYRAAGVDVNAVLANSKPTQIKKRSEEIWAGYK